EVDTPERHGLTGTIRSARSPVADRVFRYPFRGGGCDAISTARWDSVSAPSGRLHSGGFQGGQREENPGDLGGGQGPDPARDDARVHQGRQVEGDRQARGQDRGRGGRLQGGG